MNLLLLDQAELDGSTVTLRGRRAEHCLKVLRVKVGNRLRAAVIDQGGLDATVLRVDEDRVVLNCGPVAQATAPELRVALAIPRPKAVSRIVQCVSSFGAKTITLFNAWKVDKSYIKSPRLDLERLREDALLGCEQGRQCYVPQCTVVPLFTSFLDQLPGEARGETPLILDPAGDIELSAALASSGRNPSNFFIFGPDGGFIERELQSLKDRGCLLTRLNTGPLRTETAIAATLGLMTASPAAIATHLP